MTDGFDSKPILVTGARPSGTTWAGTMLAFVRNARYVDELLNPRDGILTDRGAFSGWFTYISSYDEALYEEAIHSALLREQSRPPYIDLLKPYSPRYYLRYLRYSVHRLIYRPHLIIKDPVASFAAEWLAHCFDMDVVVVVRHPAAFARSMLRVQWLANFEAAFGSQVELMDDHFAQYRPAFQEADQDPWVNVAYQWLVTYQVLHTYAMRNPSWIVVRHEDLSAQPTQSFRPLYASLNLRFDSGSARRIREFTSSENPVNAPVGVATHLMRNSAANAWRWRDTMSPQQLATVRHITESIAHHYYADDEWQA